jgi:hypothetical protein
MMACNGQGIGTSALEHYQRRLRDQCAETEDESVELMLEQIDMLEPIIEEHSGEFTHAEGTGIYAMHSKINHSW